jgi:erythronate-4-phosphate dehydrogenase
VTLVDSQINIQPELLQQMGTVEWFEGRTLTRQQLLRTGATALLVRSTTRVDADLLGGTAVKFVASATTGTDHVDVSWLDRHSITFRHAPGTNAWAVAEHVYAWVGELQVHPPAAIGIVGVGNVGGRLLRALERDGYTVQLYDPPRFGHQADVLQRLLRTSQLVTLHVPLVAEGAYPTMSMIGKQELELMQPGATLVNTARGGVVDEPCLVEFCANGRLQAVADVFADEPNVSPNVIQTLKNCTPHIAGYSENARQGVGRSVAVQLLQWMGINAYHQPPAQPSHANTQKALRPVRTEAEWFTAAYLENPVGERFDALRREYQPLAEVLSTDF